MYNATDAWKKRIQLEALSAAYSCYCC